MYLIKQLKPSRRILNSSRHPKSFQTFCILKTAFFDLLKILAERPYYILLPILVDFFHFLSFSSVLAGIQLKAMEYLQILQILLQESSGLLGQTINTSAMVLMVAQQQELATVQSALIKLAFALLVAVGLLWMFFQGPSWKLAANMAHNKLKLATFFGRFTAVSALWLLSFSIISVWLFKALFQIQLGLGILQYGSETIISTIFYIIIAYFMFISYALVPKYPIKKIFKKTFDIGTKNFLPLMSMFLILALGFFIIDLILNLFVIINTLAMVIVGFILLLPYISLARLYMMLVIEKVDT